LKILSFQGEDALGKNFSLNNEHELTVTAVIKDIPGNSSLSFDMLIPFEMFKILREVKDFWNSNWMYTYVQLHPNSSIVEVNEKISTLRHQNVSAQLKEEQSDHLLAHETEPRVECSVVPLTHLHINPANLTGPAVYVYVFSAIALFVLLIACINFMNLSTARSASRAKEVGMRKVLGSLKNDIIKQFFSESLVFAFIALLLALVIVVISLPTFNILSGKELSFDVTGSSYLFIFMVGMTLFTGIIAGSYPALFISSFKPISIFKDRIQSGAKSKKFRKTLVILQFTLSILLIIGTIVIYKQVSFMKNKNTGYDKENLVYIRMRGGTAQSYQTFKNELLNGPGILNLSGSWQSPYRNGTSTDNLYWSGKNPDLRITINVNIVDYDYVETMKIKMAEGRSFSRVFPTDDSEAFLVNEELAKIINPDGALGSEIGFWGWKGRIIGVMKNLHFESVREAIEPFALKVFPSEVRYAVARIHPDQYKLSVDVPFL